MKELLDHLETILVDVRSVVGACQPQLAAAKKARTSQERAIALDRFANACRAAGEQFSALADRGAEVGSVALYPSANE